MTQYVYRMSLSVEKCLEVISRARSDNEKLAAMLLVAKHSSRRDFDETDLAKLRDAIGRAFFSRLVASAKSGKTQFLQISYVLGSGFEKL